MPTANRHLFVPLAIDCFLNQDYENTELIIYDDGIEPCKSLIKDHPRIRYYYSHTVQCIGNKRNFCCDLAAGDIILHMDDDDWYANDWISKQVDALLNSNADITGLSEVNYFSTTLNEHWRYRNNSNCDSWVYGGTLAYWRNYWQHNKFSDLNSGEDIEFISGEDAKIFVNDYTAGYLGIIHRSNIGIKLNEDPRQKLLLSKWFKKIAKPRVIKKSLTEVRGETPLVTCIMPTANRSEFIPSAIGNFLKQNYRNKELVIVDDGKNSVKHLIPDNSIIKYYYSQNSMKIGLKRNIACQRAEGEFIIHLDDDDWYAEDWISHEVKAIQESNADIVGINQVQFFSPTLNEYWMIKNSNSKRPWLTGASLIYHKSFWLAHPFKDLQIGEDDDYIRNNNAKIFAHSYYEGFIATLHANNTSIKFFEDPKSKLKSDQ